MKNYIKTICCLVSFILLFVCLITVKQDGFFARVALFGCVFTITFCLIRFTIGDKHYRLVRNIALLISMFAMSYLVYTVYRDCGYTFKLFDIYFFKDILYVFTFACILSSLCDNFVYESESKIGNYVIIIGNLIMSLMFIYSFFVTKQFEFLYNSSIIICVISIITCVYGVIDNKKTA